MIARICRSSTVGSDCLAQGSSIQASPSLSTTASGRGTVINASISPTAGMKSGMKGFSLWSNSTCGESRDTFSELKNNITESLQSLGHTVIRFKY